MATMPVVVGVDGSEESLRAVEWAALEARRHQAPLRIVSAPAPLPRVRVPAQAPETVTARLEHRSCRALDEAVTRARELTSELLIDVDLLTGAPALSLTECGSGALMLVVGARGAGGFAAMLLGSVSRYAAMHAGCPVVVVREETSAVHGEVAVGIRDPRDTAEALAFAFDEAARRGATLTAVHSWNWPPAADSERVAVEASVHLAEALGEWRDKYPTVSAWGDLMRDHPAHVLASYSARSDLVVIGRHGGAGSRPAIGGIQHALLAHARGPVAIVPNAG
jgi:nucleotide-binding universal stress UspA family protein